MRIAVYQGETNLTDLVTRLYQVPQSGRLSRLLTLPSGEADALVKRASAALLQANPVLRDLGRLGRGAVLVVPDIEGLQPTTTVTALSSREQSHFQVMAKELAAALKTLGTARTTQLTQSEASLRVLESDAVKPLLTLPGFPATLDVMKKAAATAIGELQILAKYQDQAGVQPIKDVQALANSDDS